jgi:3-oxoadipate enol-lactonase
MPFLDAGGLRVHYALGGPPGAPMVVLSHSIGSHLSMWEPQVAPLEERFRVLRYDTRGHGRTTVTAGPCTLDQLAGDVLALLDALGQERAHFCGLSMGGLIGMRLARRAAPRIAKLALCNTAARIGTTDAWNARIDAVRRQGMAGVATQVVERWFSPEFRARNPETAAAGLRMLQTTPAEGYMAACAALRDADERAGLPSITSPTLVIAGSRDPATSAAEGRHLAEAIPGARYAELDAAHLSNLEAPEGFTAELLRFLAA